jgi:hypothetical protein
MVDGVVDGMVDRAVDDIVVRGVRVMVGSCMSISRRNGRPFCLCFRMRAKLRRSAFVRSAKASNAALLFIHLMTAAPHGGTPMHTAAVSM